MEIRRFGVGHRRPDGPPGTEGVAGQVIHGDGRGTVSELAFGRHGRIEPHTNPNTTWFIVIEGGGFVQVGDERARVASGEAVLWPAEVLHAAWTELSEMRAIVVELAGRDDAAVRGFIDGDRLLLRSGRADDSAGPGESDPHQDDRGRPAPGRGEGSLAPRPGPGPEDRDRSSGEPY